jgi:hypothetical protein
MIVEMPTTHSNLDGPISAKFHTRKSRRRRLCEADAKLHVSAPQGGNGLSQKRKYAESSDKYLKES